MMKRFLLKLILVTFGVSSSAIANDKPMITINQFTSHVALDAAYDGLKQALLYRGVLPEKANVILSNAQGNISNSVQISKHHSSLEPKFMVAIATPAAQTNLKAKGENSILAFLAVTDPKAANLSDQKNVIGVTDYPPIVKLVDIAVRVIPNLKRVGTIYNSGEVNSSKIVDNLEAELKTRNIELKRVSITNSNDIKNALNQLIGSVDVIYLPQDNSVVSAIDNIVSISLKAGLPLIANDPTLVDKGVPIAIGANYFNSGKQLGNMIADIMEGKTLAQNIQNGKTQELKINQESVKSFGLTIPKDLIEGASK